MAATAHPAKFDTIVEPVIGEAIPVPPALARILDLPAQFAHIDPRLEALSEHLSV